MVRIGHSQTFERQFLSVTEWVNPPKIEHFDAVARQAIGNRWFRPLILDSWREQKFVDPRGLIMHIYKNPLLLGTLLAALVGGLDVFIPVFASQGEADPAEDHLGVSGRRIIIPEKASI
jgi:hypothetical protein